MAARRYLAFFIIGAVIGASATLFRVGLKWDRVILDNAALIDEVEKLSGELASLEQDLMSDRGVPVRAIEIEVEGAVPEHLKIDVQSEARHVLRHLLGEDVDNLNPALIEKALTTTVRAEGRELSIVPTRLFLGSKMIIRLRVIDAPTPVSD